MVGKSRLTPLDEALLRFLKKQHEILNRRESHLKHDGKNSWSVSDIIYNEELDGDLDIAIIRGKSKGQQSRLVVNPKTKKQKLTKEYSKNAIYKSLNKLNEWGYLIKSRNQKGVFEYRHSPYDSYHALESTLEDFLQTAVMSTLIYTEQKVAPLNINDEDWMYLVDEVTDYFQEYKKIITKWVYNNFNQKEKRDTTPPFDRRPIMIRSFHIDENGLKISFHDFRPEQYAIEFL